MGQTTPDGAAQPVATLTSGAPDGYYAGPTCWGTYLHGILDNAPVIEQLLAPYITQQPAAPFDFAAYKNSQFDRLANLIRANVDLAQIYAALQP